MTTLYDDYKLAEMLLPAKSPRKNLGAAATDPVFKNTSGQPISSIACGDTYTFEVPGYQQIWLIMTKNGQKVFDGIFNVPMPSYVSSCANDPGTYQATAYDLNTGAVIGTTTFTVLPSSGAGQSVTSFFTSLPTPVLIGGAIVLFLAMRKKR